jgi:hypothetical protein
MQCLLTRPQIQAMGIQTQSQLDDNTISFVRATFMRLHMLPECLRNIISGCLQMVVCRKMKGVGAVGGPGGALEVRPAGAGGFGFAWYMAGGAPLLGMGAPGAPDVEGGSVGGLGRDAICIGMEPGGAPGCGMETGAPGCGMETGAPGCGMVGGAPG